jgi:hypothetical protein
MAGGHNGEDERRQWELLLGYFTASNLALSKLNIETVPEIAVCGFFQVNSTQVPPRLTRWPTSSDSQYLPSPLPSPSSVSQRPQTHSRSKSHLAFPSSLLTHPRSNDQKAFVKQHSPIPGLDIEIDTHDLFSIGVVLLVGCAGLILTSLIALLTSFVSLSFLPRLVESLAFAFWAFWIFVCDIANTVISRTRSATVLAGGQPLPASLVQQTSKALGVSPRYWSNGYGT